ncbi:hypothetical protein QQP08_013460, partial [Theobroma cacao]
MMGKYGLRTQNDVRRLAAICKRLIQLVKIHEEKHQTDRINLEEESRLLFTITITNRVDDSLTPTPSCLLWLGSLEPTTHRWVSCLYATCYREFYSCWQ